MRNTFFAVFGGAITMVLGLLVGARFVPTPALESAEIGAIGTIRVTKTFAVNTLDTLWIAFPAFEGVSFMQTDTTNGTTAGGQDPGLHIMPRVRWNGNAQILISEVSSTASDSFRLAVAGVDRDGNIITNSLQYFIASASTFSDVGDGSVRGYQLTGYFDPVHGLALIGTMGDLTGGNRRWQFDVTFN